MRRLYCGIVRLTLPYITMEMHSAALIKTDDLLARIKAMEAIPELLVDKDWPAGIVAATLAGRVVFLAIQKGHNRPWLARWPRGMFETV